MQELCYSVAKICLGKRYTILMQGRSSYGGRGGTCPPPPRHFHSHRTRMHLCSFPITWDPPISGKGQDIQTISGIGYYYQLPKNTPFSRTFSENLPETPAKNTPFPEKMGMRMRPPHAFEWEGGGAPQIKLPLPPCVPHKIYANSF